MRPIRAIASAFVERAELSWFDQVVVVAAKPQHRQLAGLMAVFLRCQRATRLVHPAEEVNAAFKRLSISRGGLPVTSSDASAEAASFVHRATAGS